MRVPTGARMFGWGTAIAVFAAMGAAVPSNANGTGNCVSSTRTFVQAVGATGAPVLVPMNLPVTICTLPTNVQVIIPAFQSAGVQPGSAIVPRAVSVASCSSTTAAAPATPGTVAVLQGVQVIGSTVVIVPAALPVAGAATVITCF